MTYIHRIRVIIINIHIKKTYDKIHYVEKEKETKGKQSKKERDQYFKITTPY